MVNVSLLKATALTFLEGLINAERTRAMAAESAIIANTIGIPVAGLVIFAGATPPESFLFCRGQAVSRAAYPALFSAITTTYGEGDGSTTFNVPDLRGRTPVGVGTGGNLTSRALGAQGGAETHQLSIEQMPAHNHPVNLTTSHGGAHSHNMWAQSHGTTTGNWWDAQVYGGNNHTSVDGAHSHSVNGDTGNRGGGQAHNNMQPFLGLNYIIRAI